MKRPPVCDNCFKELTKNVFNYTEEQIAEGDKIKYFCEHCGEVVYYLKGEKPHESEPKV